MQGYSSDNDEDDRAAQLGAAQLGATGAQPRQPTGQSATPYSQPAAQIPAQPAVSAQAPAARPQAPTAQRPFRLPPFRGGRGNAFGRQMPMGPPGMAMQPPGNAYGRPAIPMQPSFGQRPAIPATPMAAPPVAAQENAGAVNPDLNRQALMAALARNQGGL